MKTIDITKASKILSDYATQSDNEIVVLTLRNKPLAAIVSLKNIDRESLSLSTNPEFMKIIEKSRKDFKLGNKLSFSKMKKKIDNM